MWDGLSRIAFGWNDGKPTFIVNGKFFWKQKPGLYRDILPEDLIAKFRKFHGDRVAELGYEI